MSPQPSPEAQRFAPLTVPPVLRALIAHGFAWIAMHALTDVMNIGEGALAWIVQGGLAAVFGALMGLSWWWAPLNASAVAVAMLAQTIRVAPHWYLAAFGASLLVYWSTFKTQVPLYLSGHRACMAITHLLPRGKQFRFLDIGCGVGTVLSFLAPRNLNGKFTGVEIAPLPYLIASLRGALSQYHVSRRSFWSVNFADYDVVYAFLSPVPMSELWRKAKTEMRPGSVLISNTFAIEDVAPDLTVHVGPGNRQLFVWRF